MSFPWMAQRVDRLFVHCRELVTLTEGPTTGARRGASMGALGVILDGAIAVHQGRIVAVGTTDAIARDYTAKEELDLSGYVVMPGFVDCHTHPVFAATREDEFHQRCQGADYMAIAKAGGGILSSVRAVRAMPLEKLTELTIDRLWGFLANGTTSVECKTGYGLSLADEEKSLRALTAAAQAVPLTMVRTFLGAHEFPTEYRADREAYVRLLCDEMIPKLKGLAEACDVFAEPGVFDREQSLRILSSARAEGLRLRLHADELSPMGGAELAVLLRADSADHLGKISDAGIQALAGSDTVGVLLPGTSFFLGKEIYAPARRMIEAGCVIAIATDFNPGSCFTQSMTLIQTLACVKLKLSPAEAIIASTINPAFSLQLDSEVGTLHPGKRADFVALDLPSWRGVGYAFGGNPVAITVKNGVPMVANINERDPDLFAGT
ncbi:imidazolonepropionase [Planctomycetota bacterium]|nr:imidazolonepropionase [Planctomycetota bacterium]GDY02560.1 imidazolonepropionase [Planctomycetota bacterium]